MGRYRKIDTKIWNDEKFRALSDHGKLAFLFLLTHPHMTSLGAMRATLPGLATEIGWTPKAFREAFMEAFRKGMVKHDETASCLALPRFLKYNGPESPNVVKSWADALDLIPECDLKHEVIQSVKAFTEALTEGFAEALPKAFGKAFPKALPKAMPNQEQEQEQEQEPEPKTKSSRARFIPDQEWITELSSNPAYVGLNIQEQAAKCQTWCKTNHKLFSKRRLVNWLNRAEKPLTLPTPIRKARDLSTFGHDPSPTRTPPSKPDSI